MNARIRELAEQAQEYAEYTTPQGLEWFDAFKERFSKLLVQECAALAWFAEQYGIGDGLPVSKQIKQHFGIEP